MRVNRFTDEYEAAAAVLGRPAAELRTRDAGRPGPVLRWLGWEGGEVVAAVTAFTRPDRRTFLSFACPDPGAIGPLADAAAAALGRVHSTVDCEDDARLGALLDAGFHTLVVTEAFRIRFADALAALRRARVPAGFGVVDVAAADPGRLFTLDNAVRQDVPGTDGWRGDRAMFLDELGDPAAYAVAVDQGNGEYAGLARVWRNPDGPRFGLVGVLRQYRGTPVGPALIRHVVAEASEWGHEAFTTETSLTNAAVHPRLVRVAADRLGRVAQLARRR